jgi:hypothetical protein
MFALYGRAKVYIDSKHVGNYDFDLVFKLSNDLVVFVLYTVPEIDGETAHSEEQPTWIAFEYTGDIVYACAPTKARVWGSFTSSTEWLGGSTDDHICSLEIEAKAIQETFVSYNVEEDARLFYGDPPPGGMWRCDKGLGTFVDQDWDGGSLMAKLIVQTGLFRADISGFPCVLYGKAIVFIGSTFCGVYDFDLVLIYPEFVALMLWTESGLSHEYQPFWLGFSDGEIVFS